MTPQLKRLFFLQFAVIAVALLAGIGLTSAYFQFQIGAASLSWNAVSVPVTYVINVDGSDNIGDDSEKVAIRQAFQAWEDISDSDIAFTEDLAADNTRTDFTSTGIHLILFDEDDSSGYFAGASSTVAVTPVLFDTVTGRILDADIVFNGDDHSFSTDASPGTYDVQSVATHEIGHFIGLDHSGCCSSTMFPFTETARTVQRSLSEDDIAAARSTYPDGGSYGTITGTVVRTGSGSTVAGAHVVAENDDGVVIASTYTSNAGTFTIEKLPPDTYAVFAEPIDGPVVGSNLSSSIGGTAETDFETTYWGGNVLPSTTTVTGGATHAIGSITVGTAVSANLTIAGDYPYEIPRGTSSSIMILGTSIGSSDTVTFTGSDITVDSQSFLNLTGITGFIVNFTVGGAAALGPRTARIDTTGGAVTMLTGAIDIVGPAPTFTSVTPTSGLATGGTVLTITGNNFVSGATVFVGATVCSPVTVDSATQITATTAAGSAGLVDVIVQNPDGQIVVSDDAYTFISQPIIDTIFPNVGSDAGGTEVTVFGSQFVAGLTVDVDGISGTVTSVTSTEVTFTTPAGTAGAVDVVLTNPGGLDTTEVNGFTYAAEADPVVSGITPASGGTAGGTEVTVNGSDFDAAATVLFGQAADGTGGTAATSVVFVSATELTATAPSGSAGTVAVSVVNPSGTVHRFDAAYTFVAPPAGGGGGGGGCGAYPIISGHSGGSSGTWFPWMLLFIILAAIKKQGQRRAVR